MIDHTIRAYFAKIVERTGSITNACKYIAGRLDYQWQPITIYNVFSGHNKPSAELIRKLSRLVDPPRKRYRLKIEAQSEEQLRAWMNVPMDKRIKALDELAGYKGEQNG